ncbi:MAG: hypothetical protein AAGE85_17495 [Pseudomonadota bacterium]
MTRAALRALILLAVVPVSQADTEMTMGDGMIQGNKLKPYELSWRQCALQEQKWVSQGTVTERLEAIGNGVVRHSQSTKRPDGMVSRANTYFDRASFAPLRIDVSISKDGETLASQRRLLGEDGYTGVATRGEDSQALQGRASRRMMHGAVMGLPLATIDYQPEPVRFTASMVSFDGTYDVIATWVGKETLDVGDLSVDSWLIDVEWHHRESGDVYPPGPDASGGRYWVVQDPPDGVPYVPRYKTDTYAVEFAGEICPED